MQQFILGKECSNLSLVVEKFFLMSSISKNVSITKDKEFGSQITS